MNKTELKLWSEYSKEIQAKNKKIAKEKLVKFKEVGKMMEEDRKYYAELAEFESLPFYKKIFASKPIEPSIDLTRIAIDTIMTMKYHELSYEEFLTWRLKNSK